MADVPFPKPVPFTSETLNNVHSSRVELVRTLKVHQQPHSKQQLKVQQPLPLLAPGTAKVKGSAHTAPRRPVKACAARKVVGSALQ